MNEAMQWIDDVRGTDSLRGAARKANITSAKLIRQVNDNQLTFETVRDVSRAYGRSVLADLIALGHLSEADAGIEGIERALAAATDEQLVVEVGRRLEVTPSSLNWDVPVTEAVERAGNVSGSRQDATVHDLKARRQAVGLESALGEDLTADEAAELLKTHRFAADERDGRDEEAEADPYP